MLAVQGRICSYRELTVICFNLQGIRHASRLGIKEHLVRHILLEWGSALIVLHEPTALLGQTTIGGR